MYSLIQLSTSDAVQNPKKKSDWEKFQKRFFAEKNNSDTSAKKINRNRLLKFSVFSENELSKTFSAAQLFFRNYGSGFPQQTVPSLPDLPPGDNLQTAHPFNLALS